MKRIGRYAVKHELLVTSFSDIYVCTAPDTKVHFAIKVFHPKGKNLGEHASYGVDFWRARFIEEGNLLRDLSHPNIISICDSGETREGVPYFVMPFLEANLLYEIGDDANTQEKRDALDPKWLPRAVSPRRALEIWYQVLSALAYLHEQGLVHRDIKPSNILLTSKQRGDVVLCDFGMVKVPGAQGSRSGRWIGTLDYISPEQRKSATDVDSRSDVYSAGVLVYRMLTETLPGHRHVPLRGQRVGVPETVAQLVEKCLKVRRRDRPLDAVSVLAELNRHVPNIAALSDDVRLIKRATAVSMHPRTMKNKTQN
jgi:serine/threonine protein kinase